MKAVSRSPRLAALLTLPLAVLSAAPSIQLCTLRWCEVAPGILLECAIAGSPACSATEARCALADPACAAGAMSSLDAALCGEPDATCEGSESGCPADPEGSSNSARVFCVGGPMGGDGVRPAPGDDAPLEPIHALVSQALEAGTGASSSRRVTAPERTRSPATRQAMPPPARAPPLA